MVFGRGVKRTWVEEEYSKVVRIWLDNRKNIDDFLLLPRPHVTRHLFMLLLMLLLCDIIINSRQTNIAVLRDFIVNK